MESAVGYVVITCFFVLLLLSTSVVANQMYTVNVTGGLNVQLRSLAQLVRQQMVCVYEAVKQQPRNSQGVKLTVDMPRSIGGRPYRITLAGNTLKADCLNIHYEISMPSFPDVVWSVKGGAYESGGGRLMIEGRWVKDKVSVTVVPR
jgi:uncharacterized iron-regulated membrane protein